MSVGLNVSVFVKRFQRKQQMSLLCAAGVSKRMVWLFDLCCKCVKKVSWGECEASDRYWDVYLVRNCSRCGFDVRRETERCDELASKLHEPSTKSTATY